MSDFTLIRNYYPHTLRIDDADGEVVEIPLRVRRFTVAQLQAFQLERKQLIDREQGLTFARAPEGDEQEKHTVTARGVSIPVYTISDVEIRRRRLAAMTEEERARFDQRYADADAALIEFEVRTIRDHVWVAPGVRLLFEQESGEQTSIATGADLVVAFAGNQALFTALYEAVVHENTLSPEEKKRWRSQSALMRFSPARTPTAAGDAPDATAAPVNAKGSAASAAATDDPATALSGWIGMSSASRVPS